MSNTNIRDWLANEISSSVLRHITYSRQMLIDKVKEVWELVPRDLPIPRQTGLNLANDPWLYYPYDRNLMAQIDELFLSAGWTVGWKVTESELDNDKNRFPRTCYYAPREGSSGGSLVVICEFHEEYQGSTCKRKVIGKVQKEIDIVEFVCDDDNSG